MVNLISKELNDLINEQIVEEIRSGYIYLGMSAWAAKEGLSGLASFMKIHAEKEEYKHAMKFFQYIIETGGKVELGTIENVSTDYSSAEEILKGAITHEEHITKKCKELMDLAQEKKEYFAYDMLNWFLREQIEEENLFNQIYDDFLHANKSLGVWDHHLKHP
ncbi:MAG: ferritin [Candidatus Lokiarchaeota archaeon]|nr:ferritin [Candidatus Lokiarchaeota archaeon]